jgi:hypothetical protein
MAVRPLEVILRAQENRVLPVPAQEDAGAFGQHMGTVGIACE